MNLEKPVILNVAAGKLNPLNLPNNHLVVNIDTIYYKKIDVTFLEDEVLKWVLSGRQGKYTFNLNVDCFDFLNKTIILFDKITIYRFLEHVKRTDVLYFIYLLSQCIPTDGEIEVIVPDYRILANRILKENVNDRNFDQDDIITTTELLNEPDSPHSSIWTVDRAKYFFEYEGRFKIIESITPYTFDGRNIYLKFTAERV